MTKTSKTHSEWWDGVEFNVVQAEGGNDVEFTIKGNPYDVWMFVHLLDRALDKTGPDDEEGEDWSTYVEQVATQMENLYKKMKNSLSKRKVINQ